MTRADAFSTPATERRRFFGRFALLVGAVGFSGITPAWASEDSSVGKTQVSIEPGALERPDPDPQLQGLTQRVDAVLHEAAQDLGLAIEVSERGKLDWNRIPDERIEQTPSAWLVYPELARAPGGLVLRITATPPGSKVQYVRTQTLWPDELEMRVVLMMRDLLEATSSKPPRVHPPAPSQGNSPAASVHSPGRAILALNAALLGGYAGYSLQKASGSGDDRLTYPLVALGAGIGLGGSMLVAEEWEIGIGDAWFVSAGIWWPALSGLLLSESYGVPDPDRYAYGLLGATAGLTLTVSALGLGHVSEGGAALVHSGGAFGTLLGALVELTIEGSTNVTPRRGMGFGAGGGLLAAAALLTQVQPTASRVLFVDLAASLGALTGAAAASPLLLVDEREDDSTRNRLFLTTVAAGTLIGGLVGYWTTQPAITRRSKTFQVAPYLGVVQIGPRGAVPGAAVQGTW